VRQSGCTCSGRVDVWRLPDADREAVVPPERAFTRSEPSTNSGHSPARRGRRLKRVTRRERFLVELHAAIPWTDLIE
jgi:hypothetical protein